MKKNLGRHLKDEQATGAEWKMWQAEKLKELKRFQRQNKDIINSYTSGLDKDIADILKEEFKQGAKSEINRYNKLFDKDLQDGFFKLNDRKAKALIKVVNNDLNKGNRACLRMINDQYRKTIYKAVTFSNTGVMTMKQAVDMATKDFLNAGFNVIEYKNGRRVNISSYSQMAVRTASQRAMLMGEGEFRKEIGETLVIISRHNTSCKICQPFETKVFVDDVYSGGKPDKKHRLLSDAMEQGLFHPNCRHGVNTYYDLDGIDEAAPIDKVPVDNDNAEVSRIDVDMQKQQRLIAGSQDKDNVKKARAKLKELEAEKEQVIFMPAKTADEAKKHMQDFAENVEIGSIKNLDNLNTTNETLLNLKNRYPTKKLKNISLESKRKNAASANYEDLNLKSSYFNKKEFKTYNYKQDLQNNLDRINKQIEEFADKKEEWQRLHYDVNKYERQLKKAKRDLENQISEGFTRFNVIYEGQEIQSIITHEYGHVIADQYIGQINKQKANANFSTNSNNELWKLNLKVNSIYNKAIETGDIFKISKYAASNSHEFFAETFAIYDMKKEKLPDYIVEMIEEVLRFGKQSM
jgi:hypothetical protein